MIWKKMHSGMAIKTMYVNTETKDIIYLEKKNEWVVFLHKNKKGTDIIYKNKKKENALKYIEKYIKG